MAEGIQEAIRRAKKVSVLLHPGYGNPHFINIIEMEKQKALFMVANAPDDCQITYKWDEIYKDHLTLFPAGLR